MANPFEAKFDSECENCGETVIEGDEMYATDDGFLCPDCASEEGYVCSDCGNFKKPEYELCYECAMNNEE